MSRFSLSSSVGASPRGSSFFWEQRSKSRSRFNLLLLEFNEYLFEDLSVFQMTDGHGLRIQGRLKVCSRSLIFEPSDTKRPIVKYPFKACSKFGIAAVHLPALDPLGADSEEMQQQQQQCLSFSVSSYYELKANGKVGPYRQIGGRGSVPASSSSSSSNSSSSSTAGVNGRSTSGEGDDFSVGPCFAVHLQPLHTDLSQLKLKVDRLLAIFAASIEVGSGQAQSLLQQFIADHYLGKNNALALQFDTSQLVDFHERLVLKEPVEAKRIRPLVSNMGILMLTEARLYFQPFSINNVGETVQVLELRNVARVYCRRFMLRQIGLEFILRDGSSALFAFNSRQERDSFFLEVSPLLITTAPPTLSAVTRKWQQREISNFEYLVYLNNEADRSINDLTQYPVFPHILKDYTSETLDLTDEAVYRDLSKPVGALNPTRLSYFKQRFESMPPADPSFGLPPPFLYGTHYSTPGYVLHYLVRVAPEFMLCLQNGKFDAPDRMFYSLHDMWESCLTNHTDLKELIPEFFTGSGEFLINSDDLDLGRRHTGERLGDVVLPPWAKRPSDFVKKNAKALESEYVSAHLHEWVDLIFGYKQKGDMAVESDNLYYHLTYEGAVDLDSLDKRERAALEVQIQEFGQTPRQLFASPHPGRNAPPDDNLQLCPPYMPGKYDLGVMRLGEDFHNEVLAATGGGGGGAGGGGGIPSSTMAALSSGKGTPTKATAETTGPETPKRASLLGQWTSLIASSVDRAWSSATTTPSGSGKNG